MSRFYQRARKIWWIDNYMDPLVLNLLFLGHRKWKERKVPTLSSWQNFQWLLFILRGSYQKLQTDHNTLTIPGSWKRRWISFKIEDLDYFYKKTSPAKCVVAERNVPVDDERPPERGPNPGILTRFLATCCSVTGLESHICYMLWVWQGGMCFPSLSHSSSFVDCRV